MKNKNIVVTGGSGFIPSHLIEALEKENPNKIYNLDLKEGYDLCCYGETEKFFKTHKIDVVFDLATLPLPLSLKQPRFVVCDIIRIATNLAEICRKGLFKTLIHVSSSEAYGSAKYTPMDEQHPLNPTTPYASAKASADLIILSYHKTFGIDTAIARCFNTYGERQPIELGAIIPKTINKILNNQHPEIYGDGYQTRDFIYVKDTVRGIMEVYKCKDTRGKVINIAGGKEVSIKEIVEKICEILKYKDRVIYQKQRKADVSRHWASINLAKRLFNFVPQYTLEQGLERTINYYKKEVK